MKYKIGDPVEIVDYGHLIYMNKNGKAISHDITPNIIGKKGIIASTSNTQNIPTYAIDGIPGKHAWYDENQLKLTEPLPIQQTQ